MFVLALACLLVGLIYLAPHRPMPSDAHITQLEARLALLQADLDSARAVSDRAAYSVQVRRNAIRTPDFRLSVDSAMAVALDSSATAKDLRLTLIKTVDQAEAYQLDVLRYQEAVDSLLIAHVQERRAFVLQIDTLAALAQARVPERCAIWGVPCPNRTTAFLLGVGSALVLTIAVAF